MGRAASSGSLSARNDAALHRAIRESEEAGGGDGVMNKICAYISLSVIFLIGLLTEQTLSQTTTGAAATIKCDGNKDYNLTEWIRQFEITLHDGKGTVLREGVNASGKKFNENWIFDASDGQKMVIKAIGSTEGIKEGHELSFSSNIKSDGPNLVLPGLQKNGALITRRCEARFQLIGETFASLNARITADKAKSATSQIELHSKIANLENITTVTSENAAAVNKRIADLSEQIRILTMVLQEQKSLKGSDVSNTAVEESIKAIQSRLDGHKRELTSRETSFNTYLTSIKPNDRALFATARKASELYPRIPYYIPGTNEIGEFWIEPSVSDKGDMLFNFQFVDKDAYVQKIRGKIEMSLSEVEETQRAFLKSHEWAKIAHSQKIRRAYEKRVSCFPVAECPQEAERIDGKSSTEILFNIYEDDSTSARVQRNKGRFIEGYNLSIESALLLQAYLGHVIKEAKLELQSGTQDKKALDKIFQ